MPRPKIARKPSTDIFGLDEFSGLSVSLRLDGSQDERLQLLEVAVSDREVNAEPVPESLISIAQVLCESVSQIARQSHVIELIAAVEGVDSLPTANVTANNALVFFQCLGRDVFQVLTYQLRSSSH